MRIQLDEDFNFEAVGIYGALLLLYLAEAGGPLSRVDLARLLWPGVDSLDASRRVRGLLLRLLRQGLDRHLVVTPRDVNWAPDVEINYDVERLRKLASDPENATLTDLQAAVALYNGGFLRYTDLTAYPALSAWAQQIDAELATLVAQAKAILARRGVNDLPLASTPLFGRQQEADYLRRLLDTGNRLISIIGIGGTGKTYFVRSQMPELMARFDNRVYFIDLRSADIGADNADDAVLRAIRVALPGATSPSDSLFVQVLRAVGSRPCCLILDNFETVIDASILMINLIRATPNVTILVTTRQSLQLFNENRIFLNGLAIHDRRLEPRNDDGINSEATGFFIHCVRRRQPDFAPEAESAREIRTICRLLAGVPLAIELAALQLDVFSLAELRERLIHGIDVLVTGGEELPGNHHSMMALLDGMWQALDPDVRHTLAELSVFVGTWHREAMQTVSPAPRIVYEILLSTATIRMMEPAWFSMHPMVRNYAAEKLITDYDAEAPARRHAVYFLSQLDLDEAPLEWTRLQASGNVHTLQRNLFDLELAWRWAVEHSEWELLSKSSVSLAHFYILSGQAQAGSRLFSQLLSALPPEDERTPLQIQLAGRAALFFGHLSILYGNLAAARPWGEAALRWLDTAGTPYEQVAVRLHWLWRSGQFDEGRQNALDQIPTALALAEKHNYPLLRGRLLAMQAHMQHIPLGQWAQALHNAYIVMAEKLDQETYMHGLVNTAAILCICLRPDEAARMLQAMPRTDGKGATPSVHHYESHTIVARMLLAGIMADKGDLDGAIALVEKTLPLCLEHYTAQVSIAYGLLALCQARRGEMKTATETARLGLAQSEALGGSYLTALAQLRLAEVLILAGEVDDALPLLQAALATGLSLNRVILIFSALYDIVRLRKDELPRALYEHVLKIGAASPAMYYEMHPISEANLRAEGIVLTDEERVHLYHTDLEAVKALVAEVGIGD